MDRRGVGGLLVAMFAAVAPGAAWAQEPKTEFVRTRLLDTCVYAEFERPERREKIAELCGCVAKATVAQMSEEEISDYDPGRRMSGALRARYSEAYESCG